MSRTPSATDFNVDVEGIGRFTFARRVLSDTLRIRGRYNHLTEGYYDADGNMADITALAFVTLQTLLVRAPEGFDIDAIDPVLDENCETKIIAVYVKFREKELSFRPKQAENSQESSQGNGGRHAVVVSKDLQPGADGSALSSSD